MRLPSSGLQVLTSGYGTSALAFEEHDLDTMGCDWSVQDGDGALTGRELSVGHLQSRHFPADCGFACTVQRVRALLPGINTFLLLGGYSMYSTSSSVGRNVLRFLRECATVVS